MIEPRFGHAESGFYFAKLTMHSEIKRKASFPFVFLSFFRNSGFAELTWHSEIQKKSKLSFCISLVFS